jgi:outer membrane protein insertion porin family
MNDFAQPSATLRRKLILLISVLLLVPGMAAAQAVAQGSFVVRDMRVEGLQRISEGTVFNYLPINIGDTVDEIRIQESIRALYSQALFDDIEMRRDGDVLVIVVRERP